MTKHDGARARHGDDEGDPLLVRPWIAGGASTEKWPSAGHVPAHRAITDSTATATRPVALPGIAAVPPAGVRDRGRLRVLLLAGAGATAVIALVAAGFAAFAGGDPTRSSALPVDHLPALTGTDFSPGGTATGAAPPNGYPPSYGGTGRPRAGTGTSRPAGTPTSAGQPGAGSGSGSPTPGGAAGKSPADGAMFLPQPPPATVSAPPVAAVAGVIGADGGLCLDLDGGVPTDNNLVQVFTCNQSAAQLWTLDVDGTLRVVGKCAQVTADNTIHIIGCDNRAAAQWRVGPGNTLVNPATGQCLTDPGNGTAGRTTVVVAACAGGANQSWALP
jgi:hypothetical protein